MAAAPVSKNLTVYQGTVFAHDFTVYSDADETTLFDLTGYGARAQAREAKDPDSTKVWDFTAAVQTPATNGVVRISLIPSTTEDIDPPQRLFYDVEITSGVDVVYRIAEGIVTFSREVTA